MTDQLEPLDPDGGELDAELERALAASDAEWNGSLRISLSELLAAPDDLADRTAAGVGDALLTRSTLATGVDLLALGWHTLRYLLGPAEGPPTSAPTTEAPK